MFIHNDFEAMYMYYHIVRLATDIIADYPYRTISSTD